MGWNKTHHINSRPKSSNFQSHFIIEGLTSAYLFVIDLYCFTGLGIGLSLYSTVQFQLATSCIDIVKRSGIYPLFP